MGLPLPRARRSRTASRCGAYDDVYEVSTPPMVPRSAFARSLEDTAAGIERTWPGSGDALPPFVADRPAASTRRLLPLLTSRGPGPAALLRGGAWRHLPFLLRSLGSILRRPGLPPRSATPSPSGRTSPGRRWIRRPSLLAFVAAIIHTVGAYYPASGASDRTAALADAAAAPASNSSSVTKVTAIRPAGSRPWASRPTGEHSSPPTRSLQPQRRRHLPELVRRHPAPRARPPEPPAAPVAGRLRLSGRARARRRRTCAFTCPARRQLCRLLDHGPRS